MTETIPAEVIEKMANAILDNFWGCDCAPTVDDMKTALKAAEAMGWVMVPTEATDKMQDDGNEMGAGFIQCPADWNDNAALNIWKRMIAARPKVP